MKRVNAAANSKASHVIVGNDSDIILMCLMSPVKQLYMLSPITKVNPKGICISFDALNMLRSSDVKSLSLPPVSKDPILHTEKAPGKSSKKSSMHQSSPARRTYRPFYTHDTFLLCIPTYGVWFKHANASACDDFCCTSISGQCPCSFHYLSLLLTIANVYVTVIADLGLVNVVISSVIIKCSICLFFFVRAVFARAGADFCLQNRAANLSGLEADLALISMMSKGNDYMPSLRYQSGSGDTLWKSYLKLRLKPQWTQQ